jgi:hypothetical protein
MAMVSFCDRPHSAMLKSFSRLSTSTTPLEASVIVKLPSGATSVATVMSEMFTIMFLYISVFRTQPALIWLIVTSGMSRLPSAMPSWLVLTVRDDTFSATLPLYSQAQPVTTTNASTAKPTRDALSTGSLVLFTLTPASSQMSKFTSIPENGAAKLSCMEKPGSSPQNSAVTWPLTLMYVPL